MQGLPILPVTHCKLSENSSLEWIMDDTSKLNIELPEVIECGRVVLARPHPNDAATLQQALDEEETYYRLGGSCRSFAGTFQAQAVLYRALMGFLTLERVYYNVLCRGNREFLGQVGFETIDWTTRRADVGYWLRRSASGKGLMTEAVNLLCEFGFKSLSFSCLSLLIDERNERSIALARRLQFLKRGEIEPKERGHTVALVFSLTREEFDLRG